MAQRYIHMHTAHTVQQKVNRNCLLIALYPEAVPTAPLITAVLFQLKLIHYTNKHNIHFLNHVLL